jgi:NADPH:quinone reductase-like Zn-dependent oxidoreductase
MLAAIAKTYGPPDTVELADIPPPVPRAGQVLVAVTAAAVTLGDARIRAARAPAGLSFGLRLAFGLTRPRQPVLGMFLAGRVLTMGTTHPIGARVMGNTGMAMGAHAEQAALPADRLLPIPPGLTDPEAAALMFGGLTAADFLIDKAALAPGERLLVNGATGEVGTAALQIARHLGAHITAVCRAENHDIARSLGADAVHDYRQGPPHGQWDVVMDIAGTLPYPVACPLLSPGGRLLPVTASLGQMLGAALRPRRGPHRVTSATTADGPQALRRLLDLYAKGALRPVIGASFALSDIAKAHALAESGHKRGSCIVVMDQP